MDDVVINGTAAGILGDLSEFDRATRIVPPFDNYVYRQYLLRSFVERRFLDSIFLETVGRNPTDFL